MFGFVKFHSQEWPEVMFDRLATDQAGTLLFISVVADAGIIKGIRGVLNTGNTTAEMTARDVDMRRGLDVRPAGKMKRMAGGYYDDCFRLAYNHVHAFFWTKWSLFMPSIADDHLWAKLKSVDYTTPLLREWLPYVRDRLVADGKLVDAFNYRCGCGGLNCTTEDLDLIVTEGLKSRTLLIPERISA